MGVGKIDDLVAQPVTGESVRGVRKRVAVSPADGWRGWVMRVFDVDPGGYTPRHRHPWPHINYVLGGVGRVHIDGQESELLPGVYAFVPENALHQFTNVGTETLRFICIVPEEGDV